MPKEKPMKISDVPTALPHTEPVCEPPDTACLDLGYEVAFPFLADAHEGTDLPRTQHHN
jgi:hypothetical protein